MPSRMEFAICGSDSGRGLAAASYGLLQNLSLVTINQLLQRRRTHKSRLPGSTIQVFSPLLSSRGRIRDTAGGLRGSGGGFHAGWWLLFLVTTRSHIFGTALRFLFHNFPFGFKGPTHLLTSSSIICFWESVLLAHLWKSASSSRHLWISGAIDSAAYLAHCVVASMGTR